MKYLILSLSFLSIVSCTRSTNKEQALEELDKKSAREVVLKTVSKGDSVLHITTQYIWFNGDQIASKSDTIITAVAPKSWDTVDSSKVLSKVPIYVTVQ